MNNKLDSLTKARFSIGRQLIKPINTVRYPCIEFVARHPLGCS
jgi:ribosome-binding factor A